MDRGYCDYALFHAWHRAGVFFVTRLKDRAQYEVVLDKQVPERRNIRADQLIRFTGVTAKKRCPVLLRRVVVWDAVNAREIELLTNHLDFGATTVAAIYKDRWEIELFFKAIKQHLRIKTFVGTSENTLKVQLWTALLAILILKYLQFISTFAWPLCRLVALLRSPSLRLPEPPGLARRSLPRPAGTRASCPAHARFSDSMRRDDRHAVSCGDRWSEELMAKTGLRDGRLEFCWTAVFSNIILTGWAYVRIRPSTKHL